ncbi:DUF2971 domain-containing protein [Desulfobulbus alkaliphilus]|uniref:DUF2971 domain-containing protein n=1 Tax=Desulfobulbus alkaliphilus TaxID=869814 RepID=UPI00196570AD|nr:DUF2971 domain-containing protein [Desulfobulbus alkaliphilus]MBM9537075.1 DUF2971 domain-containing protein [Desulfobulbus alkaliphilus]
MQEIEQLTRELYADIPQGTLYHYTTFTGLLGIVESRALWASDIRYMNDSAELRHTADLIRAEVRERIEAGHPDSGLLTQFVDWVRHRITNGHLLFGASFRSQGNLLSQWRGYSTPGRGVSLGFSSESILRSAHQQRFMVGKCIYEPSRQRMLIRKVVDAVGQLAARQAARAESAAERAAVLQQAFAEVETDLLRLAAILKHPSFREEREWRIVSPVITEDAEARILFREGHAMLVPYIEFAICMDKEPIAMDHLFLGPTPNVNISMNSLKMFLGKNNIIPKRGIEYCQIPFRQR